MILLEPEGTETLHIKPGPSKGYTLSLKRKKERNVKIRKCPTGVRKEEKEAYLPHTRIWVGKTAPPHTSWASKVIASNCLRSPQVMKLTQ